MYVLFATVHKQKNKSRLSIAHPNSKIAICMRRTTKQEVILSLLTSGVRLEQAD